MVDEHTGSHMTLQAFLKLDVKSLNLSVGDCCVCKKPITGVHSDDVRTVDNKPTHDDCYFQELGTVLEQYPPGPLRHTHLL
jgi:hypothetical protein